MAEPENEYQFPLWSRFWRLFFKKARPTMRDFIVGAVTALAAIFFKVGKGQLTWSWSERNLLEVQFPIIAVLVVFGVWHVIATAIALYRETISSSGDIEYNPYPSLEIPGGRITERLKRETPLLRTKIVFCASLCILAFSALAILSWKANSLLAATITTPTIDEKPVPSTTQLAVSETPTPTPTPIVKRASKPVTPKTGRKVSGRDDTEDILFGRKKWPE